MYYKFRLVALLTASLTYATAFSPCVSPRNTVPYCSSTVTITRLHAEPPDSSTNNNNNDNSNNDEAQRLQEKAQALREQIRIMQDQINRDKPPPAPTPIPPPVSTTPTLVNKRILVTGANGRLGSMVCRYLLRNHPQTEVVAAVHVVGENSVTARGYGRLSYEVGAEDGIGSIGAAWSSEDRTATFQFDSEVMGDYNLRNLRIVECELLDPVQCQSICEDVDAVIWCATDFNGNTPRAVSGLNLAFLFRAVARPTKGRVEVEGLENMLGAMKLAKQDKMRKLGMETITNDPTNVVLVSVAPDAYDDFETPFGSFYGIKKQGEDSLTAFPSLSSTVLRLCRYDDNFVEEGLNVQIETTSASEDKAQKGKRRINRRDAARAVVAALLDEDLRGKTVEMWTASK
jgi:nucleoside-diphosphate-sugar epimerase